MKKKTFFIICIVLLIILIFPIPLRLNDGGTVQYKAILYSVYNVRQMEFETDSDKIYYKEGIIIEIFGIEVFNNLP